LNDADALKSALKPNTRMIWAETPTNPMLKLVDLEKVGKFRAQARAHLRGRQHVLFTDVAAPNRVRRRPGAAFGDQVSEWAFRHGRRHRGGGRQYRTGRAKWPSCKTLWAAVAGPFDAFLAMRGLKTLHLRMKAHCENALAIAQWLEKHPAIAKVIHPGLKSHPQHALAKRQMDGFGGIISVEVKGGLRKARKVLERCELFALAESLGGVESLIEHPAIMTHASVPAANRKRLGISDGLIRLSVGVEDLADLRAELGIALA
jgi:cystathionine gamma-lyase